MRTYLQTGEALLGLGPLLLEQLLRLQLLGVALAGRLGLGQVPGRAEEDGVRLAAGGRDRLHGGGHGGREVAVGVVLAAQRAGAAAEAREEELEHLGVLLLLLEVQLLQLGADGGGGGGGGGRRRRQWCVWG